MVRLRKRTISLIALVSAVLIAALIIWALFYASLRINYDANFSSANIEADVKISRGASGIPMIEADSMSDIFFAMGYIHAQDRLPMMEYYRALANSSSEKLLGDDGAAIDRLVRTAGIRSAAAKIMGTLDNKYKTYLDSYAAGINKAKAGWKRFLPGGVISRPWESRDITAVLLLREWCNAFLNNTELMFPLHQSAGVYQVREIIPSGLQFFYNDEQVESVALLKRIKRLVEDKVGFFCRGYAFSLPADKTNAGSISAFSFQSRYSLYPEWYPVYIKCAGLSIQGITCAGLPFILSGKNKNISFYGMSLDIDTQDFISEDVTTDHGLAKYWSGGWKEFLPVPEPRFAEEKHDIVYRTAAGPVLNDVFGETEYRGHVVTMKHLLPGTAYVASLFEIPLCRNTEEAARNVRSADSLPRVYLICGDDRQSVLLSGMFPVRPRRENVISTVYAGNWNGIINLGGAAQGGAKYGLAASGFTELLPPGIREHSAPTDKYIKRLDNLIYKSSLNEKTSPDSLKKILTDTIIPDAELFIPLFIRNLESAPITSARMSRIYFNQWNYSADANSVSPTLFYSIIMNYINETFIDEPGFDVDDLIKNYPIVLDSFYKMAMNRSSYFDNKKTNNIFESSEEIFDKAFLKTLRELSRKMGPVMDEWKWKTIHKNSYTVPFKLPFLSNIMAGEKKDFASSGGSSTIFNGSAGADLRPEYSSALMGFFTASEAEMAMDFSLSIHPMAKFSGSGDFTEFENIEPEHISVIRKR